MMWIAAALAASICGHANAASAYDALPPGEQCQAAIAAAEHAQRIPPHLVAAIGRVESGRTDPVTGRRMPWPWTIDIGGQGAFFPTKQAAIEAVRMLQAQGVLSIDVGCLQINLSYHPAAFSDLQQAFDPAINVAYGTRFLKALFRETGNWSSAVGRYHSTTAALADDYRRKVMGALSGAADPAALSPMQALARAWAATLDASSAEAVRPIRTTPALTDDRVARYVPQQRSAQLRARLSNVARLSTRSPTGFAAAARSRMVDNYDADQKM